MTMPKVDRSPGMKPGQMCFMIERNESSYAWLFMSDHGWDWTQDPNLALHFADKASCAQIMLTLPPNWPTAITEHAWTQ